jgi:hypothetical protein
MKALLERVAVRQRYLVNRRRGTTGGAVRAGIALTVCSLVGRGWGMRGRSPLIA